MMENEQGKGSMTSKQTEQGKYKCTGNCLNCIPAQRAYCASQHAYSNMQVLDILAGVMLDMQSEMKVIKEKIEAIVNNEASIFDPNETAQEGDGAETIEPQE